MEKQNRSTKGKEYYGTRLKCTDRVSAITDVLLP